jgi:DNA-directed RNA polymerase specialized sigma subunit
MEVKEQPHKLLREIYRNMETFREFVAATGKDIIEYGDFTISFFDLERTISLTKLSKRKKQAFELNVLHDMKQKDVAEIMGISTVSVGQYVEQACQQLAEIYFAEESKWPGKPKNQ